jgi:hypothetical protein
MQQSARAGCALMAAVATCALAGCMPTTRSWRAPEAGPYLDLRAHTVLILPMDIHMPADPLALGAALLGGYLLEAGPSAIALQPIKPALDSIGLGTLSGTMAHAFLHAAFVHNASVFDTCSGEDFSRVPEDAEKLAQKAGDLLGRSDLNPEYLVALHLDFLGPGSVPRTNNYRVSGGAYDLSKKSMAVAFAWEQTTSDDAMIAEMAALGKRIIAVLQGEIPPAVRAQPTAAQAQPTTVNSPATADGHTDR